MVLLNEHMSRARVFAILERADPGDKLAKWFNGFLMVLVMANIMAVIAESVPRIYAAYSIAFDAFEVFSVSVFTVEYVLRVWAIAEKAPQADMALRQRMRYMVSLYGLEKSARHSVVAHLKVQPLLVCVARFRASNIRGAPCFYRVFLCAWGGVGVGVNLASFGRAQCPARILWFHSRCHVVGRHNPHNSGLWRRVSSYPFRQVAWRFGGHFGGVYGGLADGYLGFIFLCPNGQAKA
jgi:hypothetical protein